MTLDFHLAHMGRSVRIVGGEIEYLDGLPAPTPQELEAARPAAEAAWADVLAAQAAADELPDRRQQMAALLEEQPLAVQAAFWGVRLDVEAALERGLVSLARELVVATVVPPDLEATKAEILGLFPEV